MTYSNVSPNDPADHVKLGLEEVTLWARKLVSLHVDFTILANIITER